MEGDARDSGPSLGGASSPIVDGAGSLVIDLYSATGCCLCDEAVTALAPLAAELDLVVRVIGIDGDPVLERRYRNRIPVAEAGGQTLFKYRLDEPRLRAVVARLKDAARDPGGV